VSRMTTVSNLSPEATQYDVSGRLASAVVGYRQHALRGIAMHRNITESLSQMVEYRPGLSSPPVSVLFAGDAWAPMSSYYGR
jgi:hypothetical protein